MKISCIFAPTARTPEHIMLAEELGYGRAYCYDSPAIGPDVYVTLALAAKATSRIGLATGMLIPRLRHVATTAAALATLNRLAPGRITMGVGSGFTGSRLLGYRAMRWQDIYEYVVAVLALLRGEEVIWDGSPIKLLPSPDFEKSLPVELPVIVAADGPKGRQVARDLGAGLCMAEPHPHEGFEWLATPVFGTVLDEGESPQSERAFAAAGPGVSMAYHVIYEFKGAAGIDALPGGALWRERVESLPQERRHFEIHRGHGHVVSELDREFIPPEMIQTFCLTGVEEDVRQAALGLAQAGIDELVFNPAGEDIPRELERFAAATLSLQDTPRGEPVKGGSQ